MFDKTDFAPWLQSPAMLVQIAATQGSSPREVGAWMLVSVTAQLNTIGGGNLEWQAMMHARTLLQNGQRTDEQRHVLNATLGQCCGGVVGLRYQCLTAELMAQLLAEQGAAAQPLTLFGGGHVGEAIVRLLLNLPFQVTWVDSRESIFPSDLQSRIACEYSDLLHDSRHAVSTIPSGSHTLIMSFNHAEDFEIVTHALQRQRVQGDLGFIGLIGSKTKWASFRHRLEDKGYSQQEIAQITCPIGLPTITHKSPAAIAVSVVAQLLGLAN